jgi:cell division septation protein DedD
MSWFMFFSLGKSLIGKKIVFETPVKATTETFKICEPKEVKQVEQQKEKEQKATPEPKTTEKIQSKAEDIKSSLKVLLKIQFLDVY